MVKRGIVLVELIMIVVLLAIIVGGIYSYISEGLLFNLSNINQAKAFYMAQSGVTKGIVLYKNTGAYTSESNVQVDNEMYYNLGQSADFLSINPFAPRISSNQLSKIPIKNINSSASITITSLNISWTFGGTITSVKLGNTTVWSGTASSPATLNLSPSLTLSNGVSFSADSDQVWQFSGTVSGDVICTFNFSDNSKAKFYLLKNTKGANNEFYVKATGIVKNGTNPVAKRTLVATYDIGTGNITSWEESQEHIGP